MWIREKARGRHSRQGERYVRKLRNLKKTAYPGMISETGKERGMGGSRRCQDQIIETLARQAKGPRLGTWG